jgi:hypothetical protein
MPVLPRLRDYDANYRQFRWQVPARYIAGPMPSLAGSPSCM